MDVYWMEQTESDMPSEHRWLSTNEMAVLCSMHFPKRRSDWRLGRWTAKLAASACLNLPIDFDALSHLEIRSASSGAPEALLGGQPAPISISISHSAGTAFCTVAPFGTSLGCDIEEIDPRSAAFIADYFTAEEKALITRTQLDERTLLVNLLWSGKESALKALHVGLRIDTRWVCLSPTDTRFGSAAGEGQDLYPVSQANPDGWHPLSGRYSGDHILRGWWRSQDRWVRTVISDLPQRVPVRA